MCEMQSKSWRVGKGLNETRIINKNRNEEIDK